MFDVKEFVMFPLQAYVLFSLMFLDCNILYFESSAYSRVWEKATKTETSAKQLKTTRQLETIHNCSCSCIRSILTNTWSAYAVCFDRRILQYIHLYFTKKKAVAKAT